MGFNSSGKNNGWQPIWFCNVVVITSALHAEGLGFNPQQYHDCQLTLSSLPHTDIFTHSDEF